MVTPLLCGIALLAMLLGREHIKSAVVGVTSYLLLRIDHWLHTHIFIKDSFYKSANDFSESLDKLEKTDGLDQKQSYSDLSHAAKACGLNRFSAG